MLVSVRKFSSPRSSRVAELRARAMYRGVSSRFASAGSADKLARDFMHTSSGTEGGGIRSRRR